MHDQAAQRVGVSVGCFIFCESLSVIRGFLSGALGWTLHQELHIINVVWF